jgi:hypothetical protein
MLPFGATYKIMMDPAKTAALKPLATDYGKNGWRLGREELYDEALQTDLVDDSFRLQARVSFDDKRHCLRIATNQDPHGRVWDFDLVDIIMRKVIERYQGFGHTAEDVLDKFPWESDLSVEVLWLDRAYNLPDDLRKSQ